MIDGKKDRWKEEKIKDKKTLDKLEEKLAKKQDKNGRVEGDKERKYFARFVFLQCTEIKFNTFPKCA